MPPTLVLGLKPLPLPGGARPDEDDEACYEPLWLWSEEGEIVGGAGVLCCRRAPLDTQPALSFLVDRAAALAVARSKAGEAVPGAVPSPEMQACARARVSA